MSVVDDTPPAVQAAILRAILAEKHPRLAKGNIAFKHDLRLEQLDALLTHHGYPDKQLMEASLRRLVGQEGESPEPAAQVPAQRPPRPTITSPSSVTHADARPVGRPDEIRVLINTAKGHPSKRIQTAANKVIDDIDRLKRLITEDQEKHAERRRVEAEKAAVKAEVERLQRQLAEAKAKLRPTKTRTLSPEARASVAKNGQKGNDVLADIREHIAEVLARHGVTSKDVRAWAAENDVECPATGSLPVRVVDAYDTAHQDQAAAS